MRLLLVMLKEPLEGQVKTRLAASVGDQKATTYYKALVEVLLKQLQGLNHCRIRFCYTPDDARDAVRFWLLPQMNASISTDHTDLFLAPSSPHLNILDQEIDFRPQGDGNLKNRIERMFQQGFSDDFTEVALIKSDCPECGARWINAAFAHLAADTEKTILGPDTHGGNYLIMKSASTTAVSTETLPQLTPVVRIDDWLKLRKTPLDAALKKILKEDLEDMEI